MSSNRVVQAVRVHKARINNLKSVSLELKPACFYVLTGPSGSGKSSLAFDVLYAEADRLGLASGLHCVFRKDNPEYEVKGLPSKVVGIEQQILHHTIIESVGSHTGFIKQALGNKQKVCPHCKGLGYIMDVDINRLVKNPDKPVTLGAFTPPVKTLAGLDSNKWSRCCVCLGVKDSLPWRNFPDKVKDLVLNEGNKEFNGLATSIREFKNGAKDVPKKLAQQLYEEIDFYIVNTACPNCEAYGYLNVDRKLIRPEETLGSLVDRNLIRLLKYELKIFTELGLRDLPLLHPLFKLSMTQARNLRFFTKTVGLDSPALIIFDEPAAGLLPWEARRIASLFQEMRSMGHTVLAIEHSQEFVEEADVVITFGPGAGAQGGEVVFQGSPAEYAKSKYNPGSIKLHGANSLNISELDKHTNTRGSYERNSRRIPRVTKSDQNLQARFHCWYGFTEFSLDIPLGKLVCVCGPSGSGKTAYVQAAYASCDKTPTGWQGRVDLADRNGCDRLRRPYLITPEAIGQHAGSTPATYIGLWDRIRDWYSEQPEAKKRRMNKTHFSFNTTTGRCPNCLGHGFLTINHVRFTECSVCNGSRMNPKVKAVEYKGHDIAMVNGLTVSESLELFVKRDAIVHYLEFLIATALEYLVLGQPSNSLSGGEAQRVKISAQLCRRLGDRSLYILDNPFRGIGARAVPRLFSSLRRLVDKNNSVVIAENTKEVACNCDWLIVLGQPAIRGKEKRLNVIYKGTGEKCPSEFWRHVNGRRKLS